MGFFGDLKLRKALSEVTERLETVERQLKATKLEWEDTYDRLRRLMGRVAKRALRDEANVDSEAVEDTAPAPERPSTFGGGLTPRQRELQQQILRRRAGFGG
jgi:hypothetical protein